MDKNFSNHKDNIAGSNAGYMIENKAPFMAQSAASFGVLFDLGGVLIDSETEYTRIWNLIDSEFPTGVKDFARKIKGTSLENILSTYYPDEALRSRVEARLYEEEGKMDYNYCPGARELLEELKEDGIPTALYTSSNDIKMSHLYEQHPEFKGFLDTIVTADMITHSKPDPEGYKLAASKLGLPSERCVIVEDALSGVKAGRAAGGKVIGVAGTLPAEVLAPYCDMVVDSLEEVNLSRIASLFE